MASLKVLGSKSELFYLDGKSWLCSTGLPSDVIVEIGETSFKLHKFPLISRSGMLENHISTSASDEEKKSVLSLPDVPGGAKAFLHVAKFCYGVKIELTASNVVSIRCLAEYFQMTEEYGEGNLIYQTESFLNEVFGNWADTIKALETCDEVLPHAEDLHVVTRCINSLATKACADPVLFSWPVSECSTAQTPLSWNGIHSSTKPHGISGDWWYEDVSSLKLPLYKRLILNVESRNMNQQRVAGSLMFYAMRYLPLTGRQMNLQNGTRPAPGSTVSFPSDADQRTLLETIVELLPDEKDVTPTKFLLRLLRTAMILHASLSCLENLEKRVGTQLDEAVLEDLLIPNMGYSVETLYDVDCVQRILDHFMLTDKGETETTSSCIVDEAQLISETQSLTPMAMVANLVDGYLAEVAPDVNLKLPKFQSLAGVIPDYARPLDDGIYRAIDIYLKAHPWLTDSERELVCRHMNCQKLSLEASTHAAQNERLPLRIIVQVLFFEQLRLRTSIAGWFFVSDNENSHNLSRNLAITGMDEPTTQMGTSQDQIVAVHDMKDRVSELEKECMSMKEEIEKLVKTKGSWNSFLKKFGLRLKSKSNEPRKPEARNCKSCATSAAPLANAKENHENNKLND